MHITAASFAAAVSVLLSLAARPCSGRTYVRGSVLTPETVVSNTRVSYGDSEKIPRVSSSRDGQQAGKKESTGVRGAGSGSGQQHQVQQGRVGGRKKTSKKLRGARRLQAPTSPTAAPVDIDRYLPECASIFVPTLAGDNMTGTYTFQGRYNDGRPVYTTDSGNHLFATTAAEAGVQSTSWFITQPEESSKFFLSLESDVFEPADLEGLQPWVRNNDPTCNACTTCSVCSAMIRVSCAALTADVSTPSPTAAPAAVAAGMGSGNSTSPSSSAHTSPTAAPTALPASYGYSSTSAGTTTVNETSAVGDCVNLDIKNGADRSGTYALDMNGGWIVLRNERSSYTAVGPNRTDVVFSIMMNVCSAGYGVVDAAWAEAVGDLPSTATVDAVFLKYAAENVGVDTVDCEVPVWLVTDGAEDLETAGDFTFLSMSGSGDPSEATSWAKFTPATDTTRASLVENFWVDVGCADAAA